MNADADGLVDLAVFAEPGRDHLRVTAVGHFGLEIELGDEFPDRILLPRADGLRLDSESIPRLRFQFGPLGRRFQLRVSNSDRSGGGSWREWLDFEEFEWPLDAPRLLGLAVHVDPGDGGAVRTHQVPAQLVAGDVEIDLAADPIRARAIR